MATFTVSIPGGRLGHFLAGAAVASVIGGTAIAVTSSDFTYSGVKAGRYSIAPGAMLPRSAEAANDYFINANYLTGTACHATGVNLPQGAVVGSVTTWYRSNASSDLGVYLYRHNQTTDATEVLVNASVVDNSNTLKAVSHNVPASLRTVDNAKFDYSYWVCVDTGTDFHSARINYTYKSAGD